MNIDRMLTTFQAAKILGISVSTVQRYLDGGKLKGYKNLITGRRKIELRSVLNLAEEHGLTVIEKGGELTVVVAGCPSEEHKQPIRRYKRRTNLREGSNEEDV